MGKLLSKPGLNDFQKEKLRHEFATFYDLDGDGTLTWDDFVVSLLCCWRSIFHLI